MFTTGLTAIMPLSFMPAQYGHWYAKAGFQWYDIINTALQSADAFSDGETSCPRPAPATAAASSSGSAASA